MCPVRADLDALRSNVRPFEDAELSLVRSLADAVRWLGERDEHALRYALNLAAITALRAPDGADVPVDSLIDPYREEILAPITEALLSPDGVDRAATARLVEWLTPRAQVMRGALGRALHGRMPDAELERQLCEKALVLVCGGGGGVGFPYLGAFELLEQFDLRPRLLAGTSMGALLQLLRARTPTYQREEVENALCGLAFRRLFRIFRSESRYGLPATGQLCLREELGRHFRDPDGTPLTLDRLAIPTLVAVTGIRNGALPHDPSYYEHLIDLRPRLFRRVSARGLSAMLAAVGELLLQRDRFARIYLGADPETRSFDALDAVGFSSAVPGVVHYDVLRDDPRMHAMLQALFRQHDLFRLVDGGLVDNIPARAAWRQVQRGALDTRNVFVLALDGFAPKLSQPLWYGIQQLVAQNVARNRPFMHLYRAFQGGLSPSDVLPRPSRLRRAIQRGKQELFPDMPLVARMCRPFPPLPRLERCAG
jgi:predicted acylesterase/phospholipase RssA